MEIYYGYRFTPLPRQAAIDLSSQQSGQPSGHPVSMAGPSHQRLTGSVSPWERSSSFQLTRAVASWLSNILSLSGANPRAY
jgi:hypothetical protein